MDSWNGSDIVATFDPWLLATSRLCEAISSAGLTGLHIGQVVNASYSPEAAHLATLGELAAKLPEFRLVLPQARIQVAPLEARPDGSWHHDDDFRYSDWNGDNFTRCERASVLSPRAFDLVSQHRTDGCGFWLVGPR